MRAKYQERRKKAIPHTLSRRGYARTIDDMVIIMFYTVCIFASIIVVSIDVLCRRNKIRMVKYLESMLFGEPIPRRMVNL